MQSLAGYNCRPNESNEREDGTNNNVEDISPPGTDNFDMYGNIAYNRNQSQLPVNSYYNEKDQNQETDNNSLNYSSMPPSEYFEASSMPRMG